MTGIPDEAIAAGIAAAQCCNIRWEKQIDGAATVALAVLEAAAPHIAAAERDCIHAAVGELDLSGWSLRGSWVRDRLDEILGVGLVPVRDEDEQMRGTDDH